MSEVYIGNLFASDTQKDVYQEYCFKKHIYAIGWAVLTIPNTMKEYIEISKEHFRKDNGEENTGLNRAIKVITDIKKGDFVWTRCRKTGKYWLGKVAKDGKDISSEDFYHIYDDDKNRTVYCLSLPCEKEWKEYNMDQVPGIVICNFQRMTIKLCPQSQHVINYCESLYNETELPQQELPALKAFLSPDDEEDLLGIFLQKEEHYWIYPSTNKSGTAAYEYMLAKKDEKENIQKAICQCKMGNDDIELKNFEKYKDFEIYCVTDEGEVKYKGNTYEGDKPNVHVLSLMDLLIWAKKKENIDILPNRIKRNLKKTDF